MYDKQIYILKRSLLFQCRKLIRGVSEWKGEYDFGQKSLVLDY